MYCTRHDSESFIFHQLGKTQLKQSFQRQLFPQLIPDYRCYYCFLLFYKHEISFISSSLFSWLYNNQQNLFIMINWKIRPWRLPLQSKDSKKRLSKSKQQVIISWCIWKELRNHKRKDTNLDFSSPINRASHVLLRHTNLWLYSIIRNTEHAAG